MHTHVLEFLNSHAGLHEEMLLPDEFVAWHVRRYNANMDTDMLARRGLRKPAQMEKQPVVEDDGGFVPENADMCFETEYVGGDTGVDDIPIEDDALLPAVRGALQLGLTDVRDVLRRQEEIAATHRPGRPAEKHKQMADFATIFGAEMDCAWNEPATVPKERVLVYGTLLSKALAHQDAVIKFMQNSSLTELQEQRRQNILADSENAPLVDACGNIQNDSVECQSVPLPLVLQGPEKLGWHLCQENSLTDEQINATAFLCYPLQEAFDARKDKSTHVLPPLFDTSLVRVIYVGSGGCGKSRLINSVFTPLLQTYFGMNGLLKQAPSNKAARLIGGRTLHVTNALRPAQSLRTAALKPQGSALKKMQILTIPAGAQLVDEWSQLQASILHAASLRCSYARRDAYDLQLNEYARTDQLFGRCPVLCFFGDHLQMPPIPKSTSLLAPLDGTSAEQKNLARQCFRTCRMFSFFSKLCVSRMNALCRF